MIARADHITGELDIAVTGGARRIRLTAGYVQSGAVDKGPRGTRRVTPEMAKVGIVT